jgi:hypothetical protein
MKTFKDCESTEWAVAINVDAVKRVRDTLGTDLLTIGDDPTLHHRLANDPVFLVDLLYVVCKPQADERTVSDEQFGRRMAGDALDGAAEALLTELVNFFPKARRTPLQKAIEKATAVQTLAMERAVREIDAMDVEALLADAMRGNSSTSSPASSASTPAPSRLES